MKDMNTKKMNKLPEWFNGMEYDKGEMVQNQFSGEEIYLNATELSMYDFIKGIEMVSQMTGWNDKYIDLMHKGLDWFRKSNSKAYMVLLD